MPETQQTQLVVLGGGPGGYSAAFLAADKGMQVTQTDHAAFRSRMEPVYAEFKPKYPELFNMIMAQQ